jgi:hypothetical protein
LRKIVPVIALVHLITLVRLSGAGISRHIDTEVWCRLGGIRAAASE